MSSEEYLNYGCYVGVSGVSAEGVSEARPCAYGNKSEMEQTFGNCSQCVVKQCKQVLELDNITVTLKIDQF